jgi:hypothetical protein
MDTTVINNVWRPLYGELEQAFKLLTPEWALLKRLKGWKQLSERSVNWPVDVKFGGGVHASGDGLSPARALSKTPEEATETWAWFTRRFEVSMAVMTARMDGKMRRQKIKEQLTYQAMDAFDGYRKRLAIAFYGFQDNVLCEIDSAAGAPTYTLKDRYGRTALPVTTDVFTPGVDYVAIIDPGGPTERGRDQVTAVNAATPSITLAASVAAAATNDLVVFGNALDTTAGVNDLDAGFPGLLEHAHTTLLHGIDGATFPEWMPSSVTDKSAAALDEGELYQAFVSSNRRSPYKIDLAISTPGVIAAAGGAQLDKRRYSANPGQVYLGFQDLITMGVTVMIGEFCPSGYFFADSTDSMRRFSPDDNPFSVGVSGNTPTFDGSVTSTEFIYGGTYLGFYADSVFRAGITRRSRRSQVVFYDVLESTL